MHLFVSNLLLQAAAQRFGLSKRGTLAIQLPLLVCADLLHKALFCLKFLLQEVKLLVLSSKAPVLLSNLLYLSINITFQLVCVLLLSSYAFILQVKLLLLSSNLLLFLTHQPLGLACFSAGCTHHFADRLVSADKLSPLTAQLHLLLLKQNMEPLEAFVLLKKQLRCGSPWHQGCQQLADKLMFAAGLTILPPDLPLHKLAQSANTIAVWELGPEPCIGESHKVHEGMQHEGLSPKGAD